MRTHGSLASVEMSNKLLPGDDHAGVTTRLNQQVLKVGPLVKYIYIYMYIRL